MNRSEYEFLVMTLTSSAHHLHASVDKALDFLLTLAKEGKITDDVVDVVDIKKQVMESLARSTKRSQSN